MEEEMLTLNKMTVKAWIRQAKHCAACGLVYILILNKQRLGLAMRQCPDSIIYRRHLWAWSKALAQE